MKKLITICAFIFAFSLTTTTNAQEKLKSPEAIAKEQVNAMTQQLNLNGDQQRALWKALVTKQSSVNEAIQNKGNLSEAELKKMNMKINAQLDNSMSKILSKDQYKQYLANQTKQ